MSVTLPTKPAFGAPCNGCGLCCALELCPIAEIAFPGASAPCPALRLADDGSRFYCELVAIEIVHGLEPMLQHEIGIGKGCSMKEAGEL